MSHVPTPRDRARRTASRALKMAAIAADVASRRVAPVVDGALSLEGDRQLEWGFCQARLADGRGDTLDFGADIGVLSLAAALRGHDVVALDRLDVDHPVLHDRITKEVADILDRPLEGREFDQIINCSSIEHVGLAGRYGSSNVPDGDLEAMAILAERLRRGGRQILTIPVGRDMVCAPHHRVYGPERLPRLLAAYDVVEEDFWRKTPAGWQRTDRDTALATQGSASFYSLGLFVLTRA